MSTRFSDVSSVYDSAADRFVAVGGSLKGLIRMLAVSLALEKAVAAPFSEALPRPPSLPLVRSQARRLSALAIVPLTFALGWKYKRFEPFAASRRAFASL